ncbi:unnamed protein product, partial [Linum tenue]
VLFVLLLLPPHNLKSLSYYSLLTTFARFSVFSITARREQQGSVASSALLSSSSYFQWRNTKLTAVEGS